MSFPNIPDINPCINVTIEDATALLLTSIALEEISLSGLIDAETEKIKLLVGECSSNEASVQDLKDINRSVNQTIKDITKLQMLLQYKLENVVEIIGSTTTTSTSTTTTTTSTSTTTSTYSTTTASKTTTRTTTSTTTTTTTKTKTTTSTSTTTSTCSTTTASKTTTRTTTSTTTTTTTKTKTTTSTSTTSCTTTKRRHCECSLIGRSQGIISNCEDQFYGGTAILQPCVCGGCNIKNSLLCYSAHKGEVLECFIASPESLTIKCPTHQRHNKLIIKGYGSIVKKSNFCRDISDMGSFVLTVWDEGELAGADSFHMVIKADERPELSHDSGIINVKGSGMVITVCPGPSVFKLDGKVKSTKRK